MIVSHLLLRDGLRRTDPVGKAKHLCLLVRPMAALGT
jgi:hypothetical protein